MPEELKFTDGGTDLEFGVFLSSGLLRKVEAVMVDEGWFAHSVSLSEDEARSLRDWLDRFLGEEG